MTATLTRTYQDSIQTTGNLDVYDTSNTRVGQFNTLELPWRDNDPDISCIPAGAYTVQQTYSIRHKKVMWQLVNVPGRSGIRIDIANFASELKGCIALGHGFTPVNSAGVIELLNSKVANDAFNTIMKTQPFTLTIVESFQTA